MEALLGIQIQVRDSINNLLLISRTLKKL